MKKIYFFVVFVLFTFLTQGQQATAPTLSAGLDHVTYKQGTLDVELIAKIISEKQQELVREGIKRMIFKVIGDSRLDDYSQFYIERITEILFQEKNHKVMTKRLLEESTNYLFVLGTTKLVLESKNKEISELFIENGFSEKKPMPETLNQIEDFELKNKVIKTILTICSEIPEIKQLGLLNNFNYYEHFEIYNKSFVKNIIDDYSKIKSIIKNPKIFEDPDVKKNLSEIKDLILKNKTIKLQANNNESVSKLSDKQKKLESKLYELIEKKNLQDSIKSLIKEKKQIKKLLLENNFDAKTIKEEIKKLETELKNQFKFNEYYAIKENIKNLKNKLNDITTIRSKFKSDDKLVFNSETEKELNIKVKELVNHIIKKENISTDLQILTRKLLPKIIKSGKFDISSYNRYSQLSEIISYLQGILKSSNVIKGLLEQSDIDLYNKKDSVNVVLKKYKNLIDNRYDISNLIFKISSKNGTYSDCSTLKTNTTTKETKDVYKKINCFKDEIKNYQEYLEKYNSYKIKSSIRDIKDLITSVSNSNVLTLINDINYLKGLNDADKIDSSLIKRINTIKKGYNLKKFKELQNSLIDQKINTIKTTKTLILDILTSNLQSIKDIENKLKNEKDSIFFSKQKNITFGIKTNLKPNLENTTNGVFDKDYKLILDDLETKYIIINNFNDNLEKINKQYKIARDSYKVVQLINIIINEKLGRLDDNSNSSQKFVDGLDKTKFNEIKNNHNQKKYDLSEWVNYLTIKKDSLDENLVEKKPIEITTANSLLNKLKGKYVVKQLSSSDYKTLFYKIKDHLINDLSLKKDIKLTKEEHKTAKKLYAFFLDKNLDENLNNLNILKLIDNNFLGELALLSNKFDSSINNPINKIIASIEFSTSILLSNKIDEHKNVIDNFPDITKLTDFLKFIGNIKELNKAETFAFLLKTMNDYEYLFANANSDKKLIPDLINSLRQYAIIDLENNLIEIDVASVLTHMLEKYQKDRRWSFYATVGLNQYWLNNDLKDDNGQLYSEFNAASEKIGAKFKIWNFNERPLFEDKLIHKVKRKALVSDIYAMPYVSGLLYKIANTSGKNYDSANIGVALGLTFFNSLDFNVSYSVPMEGQVFKNSMFGVSFDIPLSEYLKRLKL